MNNLVVCGDSFSIGIGCDDLITDPYGSLLSNKLNKNLINLAKGSSSNFSIYLQVKYAIENIKDIDLLFIGTTSYTRTEWFPDGSNINNEIKNTDVNYHQYPPYSKNTYHQILNHPMINDPNYNGVMLTENYYGIVDYVKDVIIKGNDRGEYYSKFKNESNEKMKLLYDYYFNFYDDKIQKYYDIGVILMSHVLLKNNGIKHYILTSDNFVLDYIPNECIININWQYLCDKYPDKYNTLHTSSEGQKIVYNEIIKKLYL